MVRLGARFEKFDLDRSLYWYRRAAELGEPIAFHNLGAVLFQSGGDIEEAERWLRRAAELGNPLSTFVLGKLVATSSPTESRQLFEDAAAAGSLPALTQLAIDLESENPARSKELAERAAIAADPAAMGALGRWLGHAESSVNQAPKRHLQLHGPEALEPRFWRRSVRVTTTLGNGNGSLRLEEESHSCEQGVNPAGRLQKTDRSFCDFDGD